MPGKGYHSCEIQSEVITLDITTLTTNIWYDSHLGANKRSAGVNLVCQQESPNFQDCCLEWPQEFTFISQENKCQYKNSKVPP